MNATAESGPPSMPDILSGAAFRHAVQRSEQRRAGLMLVVLVALFVLILLRNFLGGALTQGWLLVAAFVLMLLLVAGELAIMLAARQADRQGRLLPDRLWTSSTVGESLLPTIAILILQLGSPLSAIDGLTAPAMLVYGIVIVLSVLRLRPWLCLLAGGVSAAGNLVAVLLAWFSVRHTGTPFSWPLMLSYPAMLAIAGLAAALAAREIRGYVATALREMAERQQAVLAGRHALIFGLAKLAEYRDKDTGTHLVRISEYARLLVQALRETPDLAARYAFIDDAWVQTLCVASAMHDIGKVGVPDAVLCKPGRLTEDERRIIEQHPRYGYEVLEEVINRYGSDSLLEMSAQIAIGHHEQWAGRGYPAGLAGQQIPLAAQIVATVDVYDALTSARVYKPPMSHDEAAQLIVGGQGTQFAPELVAAFIRCGAQFDELRRSLAPDRA